MLKALKVATFQQKVCLVLFLILSLGYFGLEIYFNSMIISQMSTTTSATKIETVERYGKAFTGIGICLLFMKAVLPGFQKIHQFILWLIPVALISIGISFFVQNQVINYIVNSASNEQKGKALLITGAHNTIVPYYNDRWATKREHLYWFNFKIWLKQKMNPGDGIYINRELTPEYAEAKSKAERQQYYSLAQSCQQHPNIFNVESTLDRAFFPYIEMTKTYSEDKYKQAITSFATCLMNDDAYYNRQMMSSNVLTQLQNAWGRYIGKSEEYNRYMDQVFFTKKKEKIHQEWVKQSKETFGPNSNVPPNMTERQFFNHPDVKAYIFKETNQTRIYDPKQKDFKEQIIASMPDSLFRTYNKYRPYISELNAQNEKPKMPRAGEEMDAKDAYKSIVMPMVGLCFSIFFLITNFLSLISLFVFENNPKFAKIFMAVSLSALLILPSVKGGTVKDVATDSTSAAAKYVVRTVYYYQSIIMKIYK